MAAVFFVKQQQIGLEFKRKRNAFGFAAIQITP